MSNVNQRRNQTITCGSAEILGLGECRISHTTSKPGLMHSNAATMQQQLWKCQQCPLIVKKNKQNEGKRLKKIQKNIKTPKLI